jgi:hypothetical protein
MRLTELNPRWYTEKKGGLRVGLTFDCPHCRSTRLGIMFHRQGHEAIYEEFVRGQHGSGPGRFIWSLNGDEDFDTLTLTPSIDASKIGHWKGTITNGEVR